MGRCGNAPEKAAVPIRTATNSSARRGPTSNAAGSLSGSDVPSEWTGRIAAGRSRISADVKCPRPSFNHRPTAAPERGTPTTMSASSSWSTSATLIVTALLGDSNVTTFESCPEIEISRRYTCPAGWAAMWSATTTSGLPSRLKSPITVDQPNGWAAFPSLNGGGTETDNAVAGVSPEVVGVRDGSAGATVTGWPPVRTTKASAKHTEPQTARPTSRHSASSAGRRRPFRASPVSTSFTR